jgi:hypothetical protein
VRRGVVVKTPLDRDPWGDPFPLRISICNATDSEKPNASKNAAAQALHPWIARDEDYPLWKVAGQRGPLFQSKTGEPGRFGPPQRADDGAKCLDRRPLPPLLA